MKKLLALLITLIFYYNAKSCTILPNPFCTIIENPSDNLIVLGKIVSKDQDGMDLNIIEVLRGSESKSQIRIWDGTDFDCNGPWDMSTNTIGSIGDTIIIFLPKIEEIVNSWDVIGDYSRPNPYSSTPELKVENGIAKGFLLGDPIAPPQYNVLSADLEILIDIISNLEDCSKLISNTKELENEQFLVFPNPFTSVLNIQSHTAPIDKIIILNEIGTKINEVDFHFGFDNQLDLTYLPNGLYFLQILGEKRESEILKIIKN